MRDNAGHLGLVLIQFNIKQKDAAAAIGVDPAMITRWKNGSERLGVDSPRMGALVDFLLAPGRKLTESDIRWLRSRFAEEGIDTNFTDVAGLRNALTNYLSNDGSRVGQEELGRQQLLAQDYFALGGLDDIVRLVDAELRRLPEGSTFTLCTGACHLPLEPAFIASVQKAVERGARLRLLATPTSDDADESLVERYLPLVVLPSSRMRMTARRASTEGARQDDGLPEESTSLCLRIALLVPGRICLLVGGGTAKAPYVACAVRRRDYVTQAERDLNATWEQGQSVFEDLHAVTPRAVSGQMSAFYGGGIGLRVASDGLNPLFMSVSAFDELLARRGVADAERSWRVEAFEREQARFEDMLRRGMSYREMTSAVDLSTVRQTGRVAVYGQTFFDAQQVDVRTACDILKGYLRLATLCPRFGIRFANTCKQLSPGMWMIADDPGVFSEVAFANALPPTGLIACMRDEGVRYLMSHNTSFVHSVATLYDDAWGRMRFRIWHDGWLDTGQDLGVDADASRSVYFLREKIAELESLLK